MRQQILSYEISDNYHENVKVEVIFYSSLEEVSNKTFMKFLEIDEGFAGIDTDGNVLCLQLLDHDFVIYDGASICFEICAYDLHQLGKLSDEQYTKIFAYFDKQKELDKRKRELELYQELKAKFENE